MKHRLLSLCLTLALLLSLFSGVPANVQAVTNTETGIVIREFENVRISFLSDTLVRLEEKGPSGFEDRETFLIQNRTEGFSGDTVTMTRESGQQVLTGTSYRVTVANDADTLAGVTITDLDGRVLWTYDGLPANKLYLPDFNEDVEAFEIADTPRIAVPEWGLAPQPDTNMAYTDTNGWDTTNDAPDVYVFLPAGDGTLLRQEFVNLTGRAEMLSLSALGAWDSRYYAYTQETAMAQVDNYAAYNLPLDNLVIDTDWRYSTDGMGYDINTSLFPDMVTFLQQVHEKGIQVVFNDHPEPTLTNGSQNNVLNPTEVLYRFTNLTKLLSIGLDGWWYDRNWSKTIIPPTGYTHEVWGMAAYQAAYQAVYPNRRLLQLSNIDGLNNGILNGAASIASHRYGIQWSGDTYGNQETILSETANLIQRGMDSTMAYYSSDLMSHNLHTYAVTDEEYIRWIQYGVLSPIFRLHVCNSDPGRMPWLRGEEVTDIYRDYVNLRYRLLPVFYELSRENYDSGLPMARKMTYYYPQYAGADTMTQYMLGEDLLVAPIADTTTQAAIPADWFTAQDGAAGLTATYYNNKTLSGAPVATQQVDQVNFNWGNNAPAAGVNTDGWSVAFSGKITIRSEEDIRVQTKSDDGSRVYIDGNLVLDNWADQSPTVKNSEVLLEAGKTYDIRVEFYDNTGGAVCYLNYAVSAPSSRTVWIPEGEWIDTFTGDVYTGPATYLISREVDQTPLFVKRGAILALADEALNTASSDWSHLTLDVYPSTETADTTILYEDDTTSNAYQEGGYRTTTLSNYYDADLQAQVIVMGAADGEFAGELCFAQRDWTVRIHAPATWGVLKSLTLADGTPVTFEKLEQDADAMPFALSGGAADGVIYQATLSGAVRKDIQLYARFASFAQPIVSDPGFDHPLSESDTTIQVSVTAADAPSTIDLTALGTLDWIYPASNSLRKRGVSNPLVRLLMLDGASSDYFGDHQSTFTWTDGTNVVPSNSNGHAGIHNKTIGGSYLVELTCDAAEKTATVFLGGWKYAATAALLDSSGNVLWEGEFSKTDGSNYKQLTVTYSSSDATKLYLKYTLTAEYNGSGGNNTLSAVAVSGSLAEPLVLDPAASLLPGDLNFDGSRSVTDVVLLRKAILSGQVTDLQRQVADLNVDSILSVTDVVLLRKLILQL